jgi:uncharacterized protein (DUF488 family)
MDQKEKLQIFTIGHSTRPIEEFLGLLHENGVERLIDIRTVPRSRYNPQYEQNALQQTLPANGIEYIYLKELGGLRPKTQNSINQGWRVQSFRNYADYMQTEAFAQSINRLIELAGQKPSAIMCAEAVPWRCHRSLVGDALLVRSLLVTDIMGPGQTRVHSLTPFAKTEGERIWYPAEGSK